MLKPLPQGRRDQLRIKKTLNTECLPFNPLSLDILVNVGRWKD